MFLFSKPKFTNGSASPVAASLRVPFNVCALSAKAIIKMQIEKKLFIDIVFKNMTNSNKGTILRITFTKRMP
jgi:hypothetical protein